jgi:hypothetical protein
MTIFLYLTTLGVVGLLSLCNKLGKYFSVLWCKHRRKNVCLALSGLDSPAIMCKHGSIPWGGIVAGVLTLPYATTVTWYVHISVCGTWLVQSILRQWGTRALFQSSGSCSISCLPVSSCFAFRKLILIRFAQERLYFFFFCFLPVHNYAINSALLVERKFLELRIFFYRRLWLYCSVSELLVCTIKIRLTLYLSLSQCIDWLLCRLPGFEEYYLLGYNAV